jgi:hypothetical protein
MLYSEAFPNKIKIDALYSYPFYQVKSNPSRPPLKIKGDRGVMIQEIVWFRLFR